MSCVIQSKYFPSANIFPSDQYFEIFLSRYTILFSWVLRKYFPHPCLGYFPGNFAAELFPHISAQRLVTCDGTETFEKISGVNISSARLTPLYSEAGGTVTAQCNNRYEIYEVIRRKFFIFLTTFPLLYNLCQVVSNWNIGVSACQHRNAFREDGNMRIITAGSN